MEKLEVGMIDLGKTIQSIPQLILQEVMDGFENLGVKLKEIIDENNTVLNQVSGVLEEVRNLRQQALVNSQQQFEYNGMLLQMGMDLNAQIEGRQDGIEILRKIIVENQVSFEMKLQELWDAEMKLKESLGE
jgi:hypothetical protein